MPRVADAVCLGAAIQAAAVLHQRITDEVADAWGVGAVREVEPDPRVDAEAIRADYADAFWRSTVPSRGQTPFGLALAVELEPAVTASKNVSLSRESCSCTHLSSPSRAIHGLNAQ